MRKVRLALAVVILLISLTLLAWGLWPAEHERRVLSVSPTEMTLPTPSSYIPVPANGTLAESPQPVLSHVEAP